MQGSCNRYYPPSVLVSFRTNYVVYCTPPCVLACAENSTCTNCAPLRKHGPHLGLPAWSAGHVNNRGLNETAVARSTFLFCSAWRYEVYGHSVKTTLFRTACPPGLGATHK